MSLFSRTYNLLLIISTLLSISSFGQNLHLEITTKDSIPNNINDLIEYQTIHIDEKGVLNEIEYFRKQLSLYGFLSNNLEELTVRDSIYRATINTETAIHSILLNFSKTRDIPSFIHLNRNDILKISFSKLTSTLQQITKYYESKGATFTDVKLTNIQQQKNFLLADVIINKTTPRTIDKITINGYTSFPHKFIKHHLNLKKESLFNSKKLEESSANLNTLDFVSETKSPGVLFSKDSTEIFLYLQKNKTNKFDGLIGFTSDENTGKLKFNGYLDIVLKNIFNKGETLALYWSSNGDEQQQFHLESEIPYILNSAITPKISFDLYKQDSSFINLKSRLDLTYRFNTKSSFGGFGSIESSTLLLTIPQDNNIEAFENYFLGGTYSYKVRHSSLYEPKLAITMNASIGNRTSDSQKTKQYKAFLNAHYTAVINPKNHIYLKNTTEILLAPDVYFNELYKLGGANSIRGFNEQSIFASQYNYSNLEYRFITNEKSFLYTFSDIGFINNKTTSTSNRLYSFGLGYAYKTNAGLVNLNYAFGKTNDTQFDFNNGIFHIRFISFF